MMMLFERAGPVGGNRPSRGKWCGSHYGRGAGDNHGARDNRSARDNRGARNLSRLIGRIVHTGTEIVDRSCWAWFHCGLICATLFAWDGRGVAIPCVGPRWGHHAIGSIPIKSSIALVESGV